MISEQLIKSIMMHIDEACETFKEAMYEALDGNDSGSGLAYNIAQFKCGDADCAVTMNFIGHWDDKEEAIK